MAALEFRFVRGGIHFPRLDLWLDPHRKVGSHGMAVVTHAHSDHTAPHARVIFSGPTQKLMRARVSGRRTEHVLPFREKIRLATVLDGAPGSVEITLLPAGHVLGSAMVLVEADGESLLYTGDFKLKPGLASEVCEPCHADTLIMETTFGRPRYVLPPRAEVVAAMLEFCRDSLSAGITPILLGYSLGKSQEILASMRGAGLPVLMAGAAVKMTRIYESLGWSFPEYGRLDGAETSAAGHVVIAPPGAQLDQVRRSVADSRVAVVTGWALDTSCRFRYGADTAFPLSDHADFPELVDFVRQVQPKRVFTLHGFAADFANTLRHMGFDARALSEPDQLTFPI